VIDTLSLQKVLDRFSRDFHPVVPFNPATDKLLLLDFSANNKDLSPHILNSTKDFAAYINHLLQDAGALYGIGGYAEHRTVYEMSNLFDADTSGGEPRRLHLGVDIWGKPNTHVMAPLDGIVHSFAFNKGTGDYGATLVLTHQLEGITFHTLYGHLSLASIANMREGARVMAGEVFGGFGIPAENGGWPPHLHFQVISDLGTFKGDYPGVCRYSEKEPYLQNCPDPDIILRLNRYTG